MSTNGPSRSLESAAKRRPFRAFTDMPGLYLFIAVETLSPLEFQIRVIDAEIQETDYEKPATGRLVRRAG